MHISNRELATLIWIGSILVLCLLRKEARTALYDVIKALGNWKLILMLSGYLAVILGASHVLNQVNLWSWSYAPTLGLWVLFTGFPVISSMTEIGQKDDLFQRHFKQVVGLSALVTIVLELKSFNLAIELLIPVVVIFGVVGKLTAERSPQEYKNLPTGCWNYGISGVLIVVVVYSLIWSARNASVSLLIDIFQEFTVNAVWMLSSLVVLWVISVISTYEIAFMRLGWEARGSESSTRNAKVALVTTNRFDIGTLSKFLVPWPRKLIQAESLADALQVAEEFRFSVLERRSARKAYQSKLKSNIGIRGTDNFGYQLDLREFRETMRMMERLWNLHSSQYHSERRFRAEVVDSLVTGFGSDDLPKPFGIDQQISPDGQSWCAYRRTITGWYFGVAGKAKNGLVHDQFFYDGSTPPSNRNRQNWDSERGGPNSLHWALDYWDPDTLTVRHAAKA